MQLCMHSKLRSGNMAKFFLSSRCPHFFYSYDPQTWLGERPTHLIWVNCWMQMFLKGFQQNILNDILSKLPFLYRKQKKEQSRSLWKVGARDIVFIVVKTCLPKVSLFLEALQLCSPSTAMLEQEVWEERRSQKQTTTKPTRSAAWGQKGSRNPTGRGNSARHLKRRPRDLQECVSWHDILWYGIWYAYHSTNLSKVVCFNLTLPFPPFPTLL